MATTFHTPGVYLEEKSAFANSAVAAESAIPVFIGYTEKAARPGEPQRITSFAEFTHYFGGAYQPLFTLQPATSNREENIKIGEQQWLIDFATTRKFILFESIRLFYGNGGSTCYILSLATFTNSNGQPHVPTIADFAPVFDILKKEEEPALVVIPDAMLFNKNDAYLLYQQVLQHCAATKSRFAIFDVAIDGDKPIEDFRAGIGNNNLSYGAAYYPWLHTNLHSIQEINYTYVDGGLTKLLSLLPAAETAAIQPNNTADTAAIHKLLLNNSPVYAAIINAITRKLNLLPPAAALAGLYALVDNTRGVWKAPANIQLSHTMGLTANISHDEQQEMNVDVREGKSINVIRQFNGVGYMVWGARTLDGNSQEWRYINVRRTLIMIEQSIKMALRAYVFEPNDAGTWITIQSMIQNFLLPLWRQGAFAGATPEDAFCVKIGLGTTMTPNDILEGIIKMQVLVAILRPNEFIAINLQQQQRG